MSLAAKVDDLRLSLEKLGTTVGTQVRSGIISIRAHVLIKHFVQVVAVVQETLLDEAKKRTSWILLALSIQFIFFWLFVR